MGVGASQRSGGLRLGVALLGLSLAVLSGCAPALDWREVSVPASGLMAWFPCRPVLQTRPMPAAGPIAGAGLMACDADGKSFALAWQELGDPGQLSANPRAWRESTRQRLGWRRWTRDAEDWRVDGMTPNPESGLWRGQGSDEARPVSFGLLASFSRGTTVFQATVVAPGPLVDEADPFFEGLRFRP